MLTLRQNLGILQQGLQKRRKIPEEDSHISRLSCRDHYERWAEFTKRQYHRAKGTPWTSIEVMEQAEAAERDTPLGIVDTITREHIVHWLPELMTLKCKLEKCRPVDVATMCAQYKVIFGILRDNVLLIVNRVDSDGNVTVDKLRDALNNRIKVHVDAVFKLLEIHMNEADKHDYNPDNITRPLKSNDQAPTEPIPEAHILNSSSAWTTHNPRHSLSQISESITREMTQIFTTPVSPAMTDRLLNRSLSVTARRKRRHSQTTMSPEPDPDPADNGQVWNSSPPASKRRKIEFSFTDTIRLSDRERNGRRGPRFEVDVGGKIQKEYGLIDLTGDGRDDDAENATDGLDGTGMRDVTEKGNTRASEFSMPGAFD